MPVVIENTDGSAVHLQEESSGIVTLTFTDDDGNSVVPNQITWSLTDEDGTVINSREDVSATPGSSVNVVLSGDDLQIQTSEASEVYVKRYIVVEATYNSVDAGNDVPLKEQGLFYVDNLKKVAAS